MNLGHRFTSPAGINLYLIFYYLVIIDTIDVLITWHYNTEIALNNFKILQEG